MKKLLLAVVSLSFLVGGVSFANAKEAPREDIKKAIDYIKTSQRSENNSTFIIQKTKFKNNILWQ